MLKAIAQESETRGVQTPSRPGPLGRQAAAYHSAGVTSS